MKLILEFSEFNNMRMNSDSTVQSSQVDNPSLSTDGFSRFDSNLKSSLNRLNQLFKDINRSNTAYDIGSGSIIKIEDFKNIKILRIFPKDDIYLNVYFSFEIEEKEYYGLIEKINSQNPIVNSEIFRDVLIRGSKEWVIRIKGNLIKVIKKWINPKVGGYVLLKDIDATDENTGELTLIENGSKIKLIRTLNNNSVLINFNNRDFLLKGKNFYYFNYYFEPVSSSDSV